jgi:subtilisin-like proprotein convertase family protein
MPKYYFRFLFLFLILFSNQFYGQQKNVWLKMDAAKIGNTPLERKTNIKKYQTYHLELDAFKNSLKNAPRKDIEVTSSDFEIQFPDEQGKLISYLVKENDVMHPDLAKQFPNNKSYIGVGVEDKSVTIRFSLNDLGLYAMIVDKDRKVQYIDPVTSDKNNYKVYARRDLSMENYEFSCLAETYQSAKKSNFVLKNANDKKLRTYRLALAATGEYSNFHIIQAGIQNGTEAQKKSVVLAAMVVAMTRVNAIFENDLSMTMQIVPNNANIIFLDAATDPYTNDNGLTMQTENQTTCDNIIGSSNYDIGHVLSTGGGGVATLASACTGSKAKGVTGSSFPTGDNFYFDFIAHEMGHQFGANHTFNGTTGSCSGNENLDTAFEPGSGSTIMAYAGLCAPQNVQSHSDLYFHTASINEIFTNITVGNSTCGVLTNLISNFNIPTANAGNNFTIPKSTPYRLVGQGADLDGDPISYCWEQMDNQMNSVPPSSTDKTGTLYRSVNPTVNNIRYLPDLNQVLIGEITPKWEVTPSVARALNFRLTVRDNNTSGGQTASDDLIVNVSETAGPFVVTSQNVTNLVWSEGGKETITWDVAGTTGNGVNTSNVNIRLSLDGGKTFPLLLASNTPNDGSQSITVPNSKAPNCRVMVEAFGNFFYGVNSTSFSIGEFVVACADYVSSDIPKDIPDDNLNGVISTLNITKSDVISSLTVKVDITHPYMEDVSIALESPSGKIISLIENQCSDGNDLNAIFDDAGSTLVCANTTPVIAGTIKPFAPLTGFTGENSLGVWKLKIVDNAAADAGTINNWSINICAYQPVVGVNSYTLKDFKLYPNPSQGVFTISFKKVDPITEISIYDVLGRLVKEKTIVSESLDFNEFIDFSQVSKGLYILKVKNGNHSSSKKIQIK